MRTIFVGGELVPVLRGNEHQAFGRARVDGAGEVSEGLGRAAFGADFTMDGNMRVRTAHEQPATSIGNVAQSRGRHDDVCAFSGDLVVRQFRKLDVLVDEALFENAPFSFTKKRRRNGPAFG